MNKYDNNHKMPFKIVLKTIENLGDKQALNHATFILPISYL